MNSATITLGAAAVAAGLLMMAARRLRGTTLVAPLLWSLLSLGSIALVEIIIALQYAYPSWVAAARFVAAVTLFGPLMALLGAKRPQDKAWQFIVATLLVVLALPGLEWWLVGSGEPREIHPARLVFLGLLAGMGCVNYLPTRYWSSGVLVTAAQMSALAPYVIGSHLAISAGACPAMAVCLIDVALLLAYWPCVKEKSQSGLDRIWLEFRDAYGVVWALRVAARVNAAAEICSLPVRLHWQGFSPLDDSPTACPTAPEAEKILRRTLQNLLRRFVRLAWLTERGVDESRRTFGSTIAPPLAHRAE